MRENFIVDEEEESDDRERRRREKKKKRRREEKEEEEAGLDEEDLDLIGETNPNFERRAPAEVYSPAVAHPQLPANPGEAQTQTFKTGS